MFEARAGAEVLSCPVCSHCQGDYANPDAVNRGLVPLIKPSPTLLKLQHLAPTGALDRLLRWLEEQNGSRGRRVLGDPERFALITDDGEWTELRMPRAPEVFRKGRRKTA